MGHGFITQRCFLWLTNTGDESNYKYCEYIKDFFVHL